MKSSKKTSLPKLFVISLLATLFASCEEQGYVTYQNTSSDPYLLYLDGKELGSIGPNDKVTQGVKVGYHTFKAKQISGYLLFPTEKDGSGTVELGKSYNFFFP